jgi:hypothetical protein
MRVVHLVDVPAVVRIRTPTDVLVVVPSRLPASTVLALARLVLSSAELARLHRELGVLDTPIASRHR